MLHTIVSFEIGRFKGLAAKGSIGVSMGTSGQREYGLILLSAIGEC